MTDDQPRPAIALTDGAFYANDPHPHFDWMRAHAPLYWDEPGQVWGVTTYADVLAISKNPQTFCSSGGVRPDQPPMPNMVDLDDPLHRQRRALVSRGFTPRRVQEREVRVREICITLLERARARGRFDFVTDVAAWLPLIVIGDMLGIDPADHARLLEWSEAMILGAGATTPEALLRATQAFEDYLTYQREVIADRHAHPREDLVSILVHAEVDGARLSDDELLMESLLILIGGDETTRHVLTGGMYELLRHPDQLRTLAREPARIPVAVEEMLRWVSPVQNMARTATRDVDLHGQRIAAGQKLLLLYPAANRDPAAFADPQRFDAARTPNNHLAFGIGAHFCLGANLARLELRVFFEELLRRMPTLDLASSAPPPRRASNFICGIEHLPVEWRPA
ncbi:MAG: cytochrome P450 [Deltaproteobacteria bacterium]|nr:cytochrome P450 [Deltaproteobacteria bacterium]